MQYATNIHTTLIIELRGKLVYRHLNNDHELSLSN